MSNLNFLTLNIRGINDANKTHFLRDYLRDQRVDICFLQETHLNSPEYVDELGNIFCDFFCYFTVNFDKTKGVGILINKQISHDINIINTHYDLESRFLRVEVKIESYYFNLVNLIRLYRPSSGLNLNYVKIIVTRFGDISPLCYHFISLWHIYKGFI